MAENEDQAALRQLAREVAKREIDKLENRGYADNGIQAFKDAAAPYRHLAAWVARNDGAVTAQVARRHLLAAHHSLAAVEAVLTHVGQHIDRRVPLLRNEARTNLLLGLMRLDLNGLADERSYRSIIRRHLAACHGKPPPQLEIVDPKGLPSLRRRP